MKVILLQDVKGTGKKDDIVEVSDGFARNMLFKKKLAKEATSVEVNSLKIKKESQEFHKQEEIKRIKAEAKRVNGQQIVCKDKSCTTFPNVSSTFWISSSRIWCVNYLRNFIREVHCNILIYNINEVLEGKFSF